jgi:TolB-like protein/Flp pilus assembly protein TadD
VFLSYASQDAEAAQRICEALRAGGIEVWFDKNELRGGDRWDRQIRQQIRDCTLLIPVISANTQLRPEGYFRLEWRLAVERTQLMSDRVPFLVPVRVDPLDEREADVPDAFKAVQWTQLAGGETPPAFVQRISDLLNGGRDAIPKPSTQVPTGFQSPRMTRWLVGAGLGAGVILAAGYITVGKLLAPTPRPPEASATRVGSATPAEPTPAPQSIAVLPFVDMSEKHDQEYFSDGLAEELLNILAKTPGLHVIARTSSFYFKGKQVTVPEIGKTLGVANILEGSVRKSGTHLRVSTQLVVADSGEEVWSEVYSMEFKDLFKVQDQIAGAVSAALRLKLLPSQALDHRGTSSPDAYEQLLLAREFSRAAGADAKQRAVAAYQKAIAIDPKYAAAYAELSIMQNYVADFTGDAAGNVAALASAEKAVALAPDQADGYAARGVLRLTTNFDWQGAQADLSRALSIDAGDSRVQARYAYVMAAVGRLDEATVAIRKSLAADPLSVSAWGNLSLYAIASGDYPAAHEALGHALALNPKSTYSLKNAGKLQLLEHDPAAALRTFASCQDEVFRLYGTVMAEYSLGHFQESQKSLGELVTKHGDDAAFQIATVYAWRGEKDAAFEWLERAYAERDGGLIELTTEPLLRGLREDLRYRTFLTRLKLT